jgi:hypothetical protein
MSKEFFSSVCIGSNVHQYIRNNKKRGGIIVYEMNKVDEIIDKAMETVTNFMFFMIVCLGVPYFLYLFVQFLRW